MYKLMARIKNIHIFPSKLPDKMSFNQGPYKRVNEFALKAKDKTVYARTDGEMSHNNTFVFSRTGELLGKHSFAYDSDNKVLVGGYIHTFGENKGQGIGEIMRLLSIINMQKNNYNQIKLKNTHPNAILFHAKYKFVPDIDDNKQAIEVLSEIINNTRIASEFRQTATDLSNMLKKTSSEESKHKLLKTINQFIGVYINKHSKNWENAQINKSIPMKLTTEKIKENAKFFNELFKKHKIDFEV